MKALILNSGTGSRMGDLTAKLPKCLTTIHGGDTILGRQLRQLVSHNIREVVITTGYYDQVLADYCSSLALPLDIKFVNNPKFDTTNYIYSIFCARELLNDDILLMHGDLIFEDNVLQNAINFKRGSCMTISTTLPLPKKDFKAVLANDKIIKVGVNYFDNAVAAQPLYKLNKKDWKIWLSEIENFCNSGKTGVYAEEALNALEGKCVIYPLDFTTAICGEVDTPEDLVAVNKKLEKLPQKTVYMSFSTDMIHAGHISIIKKAVGFGKLIVGVLTDNAVASYKRFPIISYENRKMLLQNISDVAEIVEQKSLSYRENIKKLKPDYVVHGDNWYQGIQAPIRAEVIELLNEYGGKLIEFPYSTEEQFADLEAQLRDRLSRPEVRRGRLRKLLNIKPLIRVIESHSGITGLIAENTTVHKDGKTFQFDGMWLSSLCDSTVKGKPDIELVDFSSRLRTIDEIMEVTTKPIIMDGDTGGKTEHFVYLVRTLERMGVSAIIIEDKTGLKKNSLFGTEVEQTQDSIESFSQKIIAGKAAQKTKEFMIIARIESLILERGMEDALERAFAFAAAGADGIMIHSRKKDPSEIFEFVRKFREKNTAIPVVVVPTSFNAVTEDEFEAAGVNIVIYANQLIRSGIPAMRKVAETILFNGRAKEADDMCMPIKEIINLIPEE
jgi:phosphoenolpyruvate phosphomutase